MSNVVKSQIMLRQDRLIFKDKLFEEEYSYRTYYSRAATA